jgi:hypothetical protein
VSLLTYRPTVITLQRLKRFAAIFLIWEQGKIMRVLLLPGMTAAALLVSVAPQVSLADTYDMATFQAGVQPGSGNVSPTFTSDGFTQGETFSGTFIYDASSIPGSGTGLVNVPIPTGPGFPSTAFNFVIPSSNPANTLSFNISNASDPAQVQYNNGVFNGFAYDSTFTYKGTQYNFVVSGGTWSIMTLGSIPTLEMSGFDNFPSGLSNITPFTPVAPVPLPPSLGLFCGALAAGLLFFRRRKPASDGISSDNLAALA